MEAVANTNIRAEAAAAILDRRQTWPHESDTLTGVGAPCVVTLLDIADRLGNSDVAARFREFTMNRPHWRALADFNSQHGALSVSLPKVLAQGGFEQCSDDALPCDVMVGTGWFKHFSDGADIRAFHGPAIPCICFHDGEDWLAWFRRQLKPCQPWGDRARVTCWRATRA